MKKSIIVVLTLIVSVAFGQTKIDQERMDRDIEIAENALATIIKQKFDKRNMWIEVKASYTPGFGVTMRLPSDNNSWSYNYSVGMGTSYSYNNSSSGSVHVIAPTPAVGVQGGNNVIVFSKGD